MIVYSLKNRKYVGKMKTIAFDIYGTLIDTAGVILTLQDMAGEKTRPLSDLWRSKQLEYSFRRGLMRAYKDFSVCTAEALDYACQALDIPLSDNQKQQAMAAYQSLPAFEDVPEALNLLHQAGHRLFAFSNGRADHVEGLLNHAAIRPYFTDIISVEVLETFKPNPDIYLYFLEKTESLASETWLLSSNPFDVIGAQATGFNTAWLKRNESMIFDPWGITPSVTIQSLKEFPAVLESKS